MTLQRGRSRSGLVHDEPREAFEKEFIWWVLRKNKGRVTSAAEELKISRTALYELIEKLGIRKEGE